VSVKISILSHCLRISENTEMLSFESVGASGYE